MISAYRSHWAVVLLAALLLAGCKEGGPGRSGYLVSPGKQSIRVAVIPFDAASQRYEDSGQVVAQEVVTALVGTGVFEVIEPGAVYQALVELGVRNGYGLSPATMEKLQDRIGPVDVFVVGMVQDFGEVRVGPATYPTISLNARLIDGYRGSILWSGSVTRTGSDSEKLFGMGAVYSPGRLARAAVRDLIGTLDQRQLGALLEAASLARSGPEGPRRPAASATKTPKTSGSERFFDESTMISEADMRGSLVDVDGMVKGAVRFRQHHFAIVETAYDGQGSEISVKLVDYRKAEAALGYVRLEHPGETEAEFAGLPSFTGESSGRNPGAYHLDLAAGRFGIYVLGPSGRRNDIETVARSLVEALR
jgi:hypothetical protein